MRGHWKAEVPELVAQPARKAADFGGASVGLNGSAKARSAAVAGLNCAMPTARSPLAVRGIDLIGPRMAFPPNESHEKIDRPVVCMRCGFKEQAYIVDSATQPASHCPFGAALRHREPQAKQEELST